jgi:hypothetical protein
LIVKNIGGARKGVEDMGVIGNPSKYSLVPGRKRRRKPQGATARGKGL